MLCLCAEAQVKPTLWVSGHDIFRNMDAPSRCDRSEFRTGNGRKTEVDRKCSEIFVLGTM